MNNFDAVDFSECHSEDVIGLFWRSVYICVCVKIYLERVECASTIVVEMDTIQWMQINFMPWYTTHLWNSLGQWMSMKLAWIYIYWIVSMSMAIIDTHSDRLSIENKNLDSKPQNSNF